MPNANESHDPILSLEDRIKTIMESVSARMDATVKTFMQSLAGLRTRATPALLEPIRVEVYGNLMPISQLATITTQQSSFIIQVWDKENVKSIERAINEANLGLHAVTEGQVIRINVPPVSEERRREFCKQARKYGEEGRVSVRMIRQDGLNKLKAMKKEIAENSMKSYEDKIQKMTDEHINKIDKEILAKETELMQV